jgi:hypothetical protein
MIDATVSLVLGCFSIAEIAHDAISCLVIIIQQAPGYLSQARSEELRLLLTSRQAESYVEQLCQGDFELEASQFVNLVIASLDLHDLSSPDAFQDPTIRAILAILKTLLRTPGTPVIDDPVCQAVLDAFNEIVDRFTYWVGTDAADQSAKVLVNQACMQYAVKAQYPAQGAQNWDKDERAQFHDFRNDVQDLLLASYACVGPELVASLSAPLLASETIFSWELFEAYLFCIGALSDVVSNNLAVLGGYVSDILDSQTWQFLLAHADQCPDRARQGAINFVSQNTSILQQDHRHLISSINFLFASLPLPDSMASASRAISVLCHRQRSLLVDGLPQFLNAISSIGGIWPEERHRVLGAMAAVIQGIDSEGDKVDALHDLVGLVDQPSTLHGFENFGPDLARAIDRLQALAAIGKGLREPPEVSVDLDAHTNPERTFWSLGGGSHVQRNVQNTISDVLSAYPNEPLLMEAACEILKSGFTESHPSPFKFPTGWCAIFLSQGLFLEAPRIGLTVNTISTFLASNASHANDIQDEFLQVISPLTRNQRVILDALGENIEYDDHEFAHSSLECFTRVLPSYGYYFGDKSRLAEWQTLFEYALRVLSNADTLPRRSCAHFWVRNSDRSPSAPELDLLY